MKSITQWNAILLVATLGFSAGAAVPPKLKVDERPVARETRPAVSYTSVVKKVAPNVVNIYTARNSRGDGRVPMLDDPIFRRFFGPLEGIPRERRQRSLGSGVIVTEDGYILTNNHVVENADEIKVVFADGQQEFSATVVGTDPETDIAVIKVEGKTLPAITTGNSDLLEVGDVVLAIGNPFGVGQTVTEGIVSAKSRGGMGIVDYEDFIQTDASINPGNSGGGLVDTEGRLVGVNTAILSQSGGNQGIGFAVPINLVRYVMEQIVTEGKVTRGYLGVVLQPVTPELAAEFKLPKPMGALVSDVSPRSPAARAGLKEGDVIIEFNGKKVIDSRSLRLAASQMKPGTEATVKVVRDGKERTFTVTLGELPNQRLSRTGRPEGRGPNTEPGFLPGVQIADLDARARSELKVPEEIRGGVLVTDVVPTSPAASAGLRAGDVILEINRKPVSNVNEARKLARDSKGERTLLRVWSDGGTRYVAVPNKDS